VTPIWLGVSTSSSEWQQGDDCVVGDASHNQRDVLQYFDYPQVSIIDGLGPFLSPELQNWFCTVFCFDNFGHPGKTGHKILGHLLFNLIYQHYVNLKFPVFPGVSYQQRDISAIKLRFISDEDFQKHMANASLTINLVDDKSRGQYEQRSSGWTVLKDKPLKPAGYIAHIVGSTFSLKINGTDLQRHLQSYTVSITALKSYEDIGIFKLSIMRLSTIANQYYTSQNVTVDCRWKHHASEPDVVEVSLDKMTWQGLTENDSMLMEFAVLEVTSSKKESAKSHKIKLFSVNIF
jgi:hypothetical protein